MKTIETNIIYENPLPQLRSRQAYFPWLAKCADGRIAAVYGIGEAFESVDMASYISYSSDGGKTWTAPEKMLDHSAFPVKISESSKAIALSDGRLITLGYAFDRTNPELPMGNPVTGGLLDDYVFWAESRDNGKTWTKPAIIECAWGPHVEASAPITVLKNGAWITPITGFLGWEGQKIGKTCGRALRSDDEGKTWNDAAVCMDFGDDDTCCYEQRMCELESGTIVNIAWNEVYSTGERKQNHFTYSTDGGKTWSKPETTGILGQASSLLSLGGEKLLAIHAVRRDTDRPGIYGYVVDFSEKTWNIIDSALLWEPVTPILRDSKMAEIFAFLKFGQPGAIMLDDGSLLMSHWYAEDGRYKTVATKIEL